MSLEVRSTPLRYEGHLDGVRVGELAITRHGDVVTALHTRVEPEAEGKGVGSTLARTLFEDARSAGRRIHVECPFVADWIKRHPEYTELLAA